MLHPNQICSFVQISAYLIDACNSDKIVSNENIAAYKLVELMSC